MAQATAPTSTDQTATPAAADVSTSLYFFVNGKEYSLESGSFPPDAILLNFLRSDNGVNGPGLKGTKLGCGEGGCGACAVCMAYFDIHEQKVPPVLSRHSTFSGWKIK